MKANSGRKPKDKKFLGKKPIQKPIKKPKNICLVIEQDLHDFIKAQAIHKSNEEGQLIEANELIREALRKAFPCPSQGDMFGS